MIFEALYIIKEQLENYFASIDLGKIIELDNIALWESGSEDANRISGKVVMTLLKLEEEPVMRNPRNVSIKEDKAEISNPLVNLNLYLLISANCDTYSKSLRSISAVIEFFQGQSLFTSSNTVYDHENVEIGEIKDFKLILRLYTPTFDEMNNIWGTLGGRQLPFVIYKVQMIRISREKTVSSTGIITHVGETIKKI
jgi:hypothetical protein